MELGLRSTAIFVSKLTALITKQPLVPDCS